MSLQFSTNLTKLRRDKNITQKQAALELGISQALLSHYENGIRECNLEFVKKAAQYYEVTSDYLLGLSEVRNTKSDLYDVSDLETDNKTIPLTVLRTMVHLTETAAHNGENAELMFTDYFSLCIRKYLTLQGYDKKNIASVCDLAISDICNQINKVFSHAYTPENKTLTVDTLGRHSDMLMNKILKEML